MRDRGAGAAAGTGTAVPTSVLASMPVTATGADGPRPPRRERRRADLLLLRRVLALLAPQRGRILGLAGAVLVQALSAAAAPFLIRAMLDDALPHRDVPLLIGLGVATALAAACGGVAGVGATHLSHSSGHAVVHRLRTAMFEHLQRMPLTFFTHTRTAELQTHLVTDVDGLVLVLTGTTSSAIQNGMLLLATGTALMVLDWRLGGVAVLAAVLLIVITGRTGPERRALTTRRQRGFAVLGGLIEESLSGPAVLLARTFGREPDQRRRFRVESRDLADVQLRGALSGRWRTAVRGAALVTLPAAVYTVAGLQIAAGATLSIGTVVAFATTLTRVIRPVTAMQNASQGFAGSLALFERIFAVLDLPAPRHRAPDAPPLRVTDGALRAEEVSVTYQGAGRPALDGVSLSAAPGTMTALVGASGAGKSTLAQVLLGLLPPDRGRVLVDGQDLAGVDPDTVADGIGFVAQDTYLFHTTVRENLLFARPDASDADLERACRAARIHEQVVALPRGYDTLVGERGHRFSGGERQRLSLARLLLRDPPVVVLDEATSALDTRTEAAIRATLDERAAGRTTVVIAHRLSTVRAADQIAVLDRGRIVERGTHAGLMAAGGYYRRLVEAGEALGRGDPVHPATA
ncbi:MAG TPA: ABC transporter ATP-binding protein [Pseudonocardia sp.]